MNIKTIQYAYIQYATGLDLSVALAASDTLRLDDTDNSETNQQRYNKKIVPSKTLPVKESIAINADFPVIKCVPKNPINATIEKNVNA